MVLNGNCELGTCEGPRHILCDHHKSTLLSLFLEENVICHKRGHLQLSWHVGPRMTHCPRLVRSGTSSELVLECQVRFRSSEQRGGLRKDGGRKASLLLCSLDIKHQGREALPSSGC